MATVGRGALLQEVTRLYHEGTLSGERDGGLLERYIKQGDELAFEALVKRHAAMVMGVCRRQLSDPRDVEDAFQATFLILVRKASTIRDRELLGNWLFGVAVRVARRVRSGTLKRRGREVAIEEVAGAITASPSSTAVDADLDGAVNALPRRYRVPIVLCYLECQTHEEAALALGCPVGTVRSRLARGRALLRRRLSVRGHAESAAILASLLGQSAPFFPEPVPSSLVGAAVRAALGFGKAQGAGIGSASAAAIALTQGVLMTMKFAQWKAVTLIALATTVTAGTVVAVSHGAWQSASAVAETKNSDGGFHAQGAGAALRPDQGAGGRKPDETSVESRLKGLEDKLGELLKRLTSAPPSTTVSFTPKGRSQSDRRIDDDGKASRLALSRQHRTIAELEAELALALQNEERIEIQVKSATVPISLWEEARGRVLLTKAALEGLSDELSEEAERLQLEISRKRAGREKENADAEVARTVVSRNRRLNERKSGIVSAEDAAKAEWELQVATAEVAITDAEIAEVALLVRQLADRCARIKRILKRTDNLKNAPSVPRAENPPPPAPGSGSP
jgi:RNA polymerase sigma factor (sigma-70 family)